MENLLPDRDRGRKTDCRIDAPACGGGGDYGYGSMSEKRRR